MAIDDNVACLMAAGIIEPFDRKPSTMCQVIDFLAKYCDGLVILNGPPEAIGRGFRYKCHNGWMVSVKWRQGNYCQHRYTMYEGPCDSKDGEVGIIHPDGRMITISDDMQIIHSNGDDGRFADNVHGWVSPSKLIEYIQFVEEQ